MGGDGVDDWWVDKKREVAAIEEFRKFVRANQTSRGGWCGVLESGVWLKWLEKGSISRDSPYLDLPTETA